MKLLRIKASALRQRRALPFGPGDVVGAHKINFRTRLPGRPVCLPVEEIEPPHGVTASEDWRTIRDDMRRRGWHGRPLLVYEHFTPYNRRMPVRAQPEWYDSVFWYVRHRIPAKYQAVTGSHRISAARAARLKCIPAIVIGPRAIRALKKEGIITRTEGVLMRPLPSAMASAFRSAGLQRLARLVALGGLW